LLVQVNTNPALRSFRDAIIVGDIRLNGKYERISVDSRERPNEGFYGEIPINATSVIGGIVLSSHFKNPSVLAATIVQEFHHAQFRSSATGRIFNSEIDRLSNSNLTPTQLALAKASVQYLIKINDEVLSEIKEMIFWYNEISTAFTRSTGRVPTQDDLAFMRGQYVLLRPENDAPRLPMFDKLLPSTLAGKVSDPELAPVFLKQGWEVFRNSPFFQNSYLDQNAKDILAGFNSKNPNLRGALTLDKLRALTYRRATEDGTLLVMPEGVASPDGTVFNIPTDDPSRSLQIELIDGNCALVIFDKSASGEWTGVGFDGLTQAVIFTSSVAIEPDGSRTERRQYLNGLREDITFDLTGLEFSRTSTGTLNGQPFERISYSDGRVAETLFDNSGVKTGTAISQSIGTDTTIRYLDAAGAWQFTVSTQPDDNGFQIRVTETPNGRSTVELLQLSDPNNPSSAQIFGE
jgi:hypothetical protein